MESDAHWRLGPVINLWKTFSISGKFNLESDRFSQVLSEPQGQWKIITHQKRGKVTGHFEQEDNRGLLLHTARVHHARTCSVMPRFVIWSSPCCYFSNYVCQSPCPYEFITGREKTIATGKERQRERETERKKKATGVSSSGTAAFN